MLELLLILAVVVYLVSKLDKHHFEQAKAPEAGLRPGAGERKPEEAPRPTLRLSIEGTQRPYLRSTGFVKGFGVNPQSVQDIRV